MSFSSIAIFSPGLLGGSLALAVRKRMPGVEIRIWARRSDAAENVRSLNLANVASTDPVEVATGADLIVLCMPIGAMSAIAGQILPVVKRETIITDVGSVKKPVVEELESVFTGKAEFIGSHPMAGSEQAGIDAAHPDLFEGAITIVTPTSHSNPGAVSAVVAFWQRLGCRVAQTDPRRHDEAMAIVSHLPHLTAAALVQTAIRENPAALEWRGNGFLDTTRVASGPPPMWAEILIENREAMKKAIHAMIENLSEVTKLLDAGDTGAIEHFLAEARDARDRIKKKPIS